jgi:hypothetical protein
MRERLLSWILWAIVKVVGWSLRITIVGDEQRRALRARGVPFVWSIWHGRQFLLYRFDPGEPLTIITSPSRDGRLQAAVLRRFGMETVWGSSSRGGAAALVGVIRAMRAGRTGCIAVDGPRGPAYTVKRGVLLVAQKTGGAVLPVVASARRAWKLRSWDQMLIPAPFTRAVVIVGEPLDVPADASHEALEPLRAELEARMQRMTARADAWFLPPPSLGASSHDHHDPR